ncbi:DNA ligase D [Epilithonimonas tenax]|uniref:DNA ligase D n=1 Tax=Epilithonimonas tenax TaxID=191577 RepID=UPI00040D3572|nr:DNA ligase D [Epilithonimonas tenax]
MALEDYNHKRNFKETTEPNGKVKASGEKLKFVIQRHAASRLHYDFRLEMDGVLKSWAIPKGPSLNPSDKRLAMMVEDHPYDYRTFEGSIPKGNYGAGEVEIWDEGTYEPIEKVKGKTDDLAMRAELHKQSLKFILHGKKLKGEFALVKIKNPMEDNAWLLIKHKDDFAVSEDYDAEAHTAKNSKVTAYLTGKDSKKKNTASDGIKPFKNYTPALSGEKKLSEFIRPMLCKTTDKAFDDADWAFEIKWDGYRAIADLRHDDLGLYSRNGLDFSQKFKKVTNALKLQEHEMILDGELVAYDDKGKPNFQWLQRIGDHSDLALIYQVFDLLWLNGHSTEKLTYLQRKELLKDALVQNEIIQFSDHILKDGKAFFQAANDLGLEGIVAKKTDSVYRENIRSSEWLKIKINQTDEALICGFTEPKGSRNKFGSLILGKYLDGEMVFCGHTGTGFNEKTLDELHQLMEPLVTEKSVFKITPKTNAKATWIRPELVAEIKFTEVTRDHIYRHPVFLRLREDVKSDEVAFNSENKLKNEKVKKTEPKHRTANNELTKKIGKQALKLTNQNKIYFPDGDVSKGDVIDYYQSISKYILPYLRNRPQSMNRFPNGIKGLSFYQKDASEETPDWIEIEKVFSESSDKYINYIICNDKETLAYLNNLGCIELNVWTSRLPKADFPDYLVLDLDPSDENTFEDVIETALAVKEVLESAGIKAVPKTSGSSGIHIYIPMGAKYDYDQVKDFGHLLMQMVRQKLPDLTTLERSLQKRDKQKIYLDYLQNRRGQTLASVYSLRPKNGAPVSMPLEWEEVKAGLKPTDFNIHNALDRLIEKGDLFRPILGKGIDMLKAIKKLEQ